MNQTNLDSCYEVPAVLQTFESPLIYDNKSPRVVKTFPEINVFPAVTQLPDQGNKLGPYSTVMVEFDEPIFYSDNATYLESDLTGRPSKNRGMLRPGFIHQNPSAITCFQTNDNIVQLNPTFYKGMTINRNQLLVSADLDVFPWPLNSRYCLHLPYGFLRDAAGNYFPQTEEGYTLVWYTVMAVMTPDYVRPFILSTNFENGGVVTEQPLNPVLTFHYTEGIVLNEPLMTGRNITFNGSGHVFGIPVSDSNQTHIDPFGLITIQFKNQMLRTGTTYNVTFDEHLFRDSHTAFLV